MWSYAGVGVPMFVTWSGSVGGWGRRTMSRPEVITPNTIAISFAGLYLKNNGL